MEKLISIYETFTSLSEFLFNTNSCEYMFSVSFTKRVYIIINKSDRPRGKGPYVGNFNFEIRRRTAKTANFILFYFFRSGDAEGFIESSQLFQSC